MKRFKLTATLLEDLHSGAGLGSVAVDALQLRDRRGRPALRASHVLGVLREHARLLADAELGAHTGFTPAHVEELFGKSTAASGGKLIAQSLYWVDGGKVRVWTSSSRVPGSRVPAQDHMHTREFVPRGSSFSGSVWLDSDNGALERLLKAAVLHTDVLGGRRERGSGVVKLSLEPPKTTADRAGAASKQGSKDKRRLRLLLRALDPLALPATGNPGNVVPSECYIRGQQVLGACGSYAFSAGNSTAAAEMLSGAILFSNAYPLPDLDFAAWSEGKLAQCEIAPMPLTLRRVKPGGGTGAPWPWWAAPKEAGPGIPIAYDKAVVDRFAAAPSPQGDKTKRPGDREFLFRYGASDWLRFQPTMLDHMRNATPTVLEPDGALFVEEEIAENTRFVCDVHFPADGETAERFVAALHKVLDGQDCLTVGRGGRPVVVECWTVLASVDQGFSKPDTNGLTLSLFLESDLIARDESLNFASGLDLDLLLTQAKADKGLRERAAAAQFEVQSECDAIPIYGFNYASGLPRSPAIAVRRGSMLQVKARDTGAQAVLGEVGKSLAACSAAFGDRTWEGFGRIRLNFDPMKKSREDAAPNFPPAELWSHSNAAVHEQGVEDVMVAVERAAEAIIASVGKLTTVTQWSGFRADILARKSDEVSTYFDYLRDHRASTKAGAFWANHCGGKPLHQYLRERFDELKTTTAKRQFADLLVRKLRINLNAGRPRE